MPFQVSPGVNVTEIDLSTVVPAVSTTEGAIVGVFSKGPVYTRVLVDSEETLYKRFGGPTSDNFETWFTAANFLAYGNKLYVTRVTASDATSASEGGTADAVLTPEAAVLITDEGSWVSSSVGTLGNSIEVSVCYNSDDFSSDQICPAISTGDISASFLETAITASGLKVGDLVRLGSDSFGFQELEVVSIGTSDGTNQLVTFDRKYQLPDIDSATLTRKWKYHNLFDSAPDTGSIHVVVIDEDGEITGTAETALEVYANLSLTAGTKDDQGNNVYWQERINESSNYIWATGTAPVDGVAGPDYISLSGASDGANATESNVGLSRLAVGYQLYRSAEDVDVSLILCGKANATVAQYVIDNICEYRKDCVAFVSPERGDVVLQSAGAELDQIVGFRNTLSSTSYAVMDSGYKYQYDKYNDVYRYVPLNGDTAGLCVRTDNERDPWWSPAGYNRGIIKNVVQLAYNPNKANRDILYKAGINPVITQPGQGTLLFGDKTLLSKPSAFDRINVRRLFIVLEKAIATAAKYTLFEFNDEFTRAQFKNLVEPFLRDVKGRRGIYDFRVVCDETNNTPEVIDRNEFVGDIYIKPAKSINFIQLNFIAVRTGVDFEEIVGKF